MDKFVQFANKKQNKVKICISLCLALLFCMFSPYSYTFAADYDTTTFYHSIYTTSDGITSYEDYYTYNSTSYNYENSLIYAMRDGCEKYFERLGLTDFSNTNREYFVDINDLFNDSSLFLNFTNWLETDPYNSLGVQIVHYKPNTLEDVFRVNFYFYRCLEENSVVYTNDTQKYLMNYPGFTLVNDTKNIMMPYGARIQDSGNSITFSYPYLSTSWYHNSGATFSANINNTLNNTYNKSYTAYTSDYDDLDKTVFTSTNIDFIIVSYFVGDYQIHLPTVTDMDNVYVNCFPYYEIGSSFSNLRDTGVINDIGYVSIGPVINLTNANLRSYSDFLYVNSSNLTYTEYDYLAQIEGGVTPEVTPEVTSGAAYPTQVPYYTQMPYPTQEPYYTQVPYPTQEPYYTQVPYPTQEPYYTQVPYPTQVPYYTQIPYPSGLNGLGDLTDTLLTPMASPTGSVSFDVDFGLSDVSNSIDLDSDLSGSSSVSFFMALINILWDRGNLIYYGYFTLTVGLIFVYYLLGHGRRG